MPLTDINKRKEYNRKYWENNKQKLAQQNKQRRLDNIEVYKERDKKYYLEHLEQKLKYQVEWRLNHIEQHKEYCKEHYQNNRISRDLSTKAEERKLRIRLFKILGGAKCKYCPCQIYQCLHFDHVNGNGGKDRIKHKSNHTVWRYYVNNPELTKRELQVLCANCNYIKRWKEFNKK